MYFQFISVFKTYRWAMILITYIKSSFNKIYQQAKYRHFCFSANFDKLIQASFLAVIALPTCSCLILNIHDWDYSSCRNLKHQCQRLLSFLLVVQSYIRSHLPQLLKYHSSCYFSIANGTKGKHQPKVEWLHKGAKTTFFSLKLSVTMFSTYAGSRDVTVARKEHKDKQSIKRLKTSYA